MSTVEAPTTRTQQIAKSLNGLRSLIGQYKDPEPKTLTLDVTNRISRVLSRRYVQKSPGGDTLVTSILGINNEVKKLEPVIIGKVTKLISSLENEKSKIRRAKDAVQVVKDIKSEPDVVNTLLEYAFDLDTPVRERLPYTIRKKDRSKNYPHAIPR